MMMCVVETADGQLKGAFPNDELAADYARLHCGRPWTVRSLLRDPAIAALWERMEPAEETAR